MMNNKWLKYGGIIALVLIALFMLYKRDVKMAGALMLLVLVAAGVLVGYSANKLATT